MEEFLKFRILVEVYLQHLALTQLLWSCSYFLEADSILLLIIPLLPVCSLWMSPTCCVRETSTLTAANIAGCHENIKIIRLNMGMTLQ